MKVFKSVLFVLLWLGQIAAIVWAGAHVVGMNMVPTRLLLLAGVAAGLIVVLEGLLFLSGMRAKKGKHPGLLRRILACLFILVMLGASAYGASLSDKVTETVTKVTQPQGVTTTYAVYVLKDDAAETLDDAKDYDFGVTLSYDSVHTRKAVAALSEYFGGDVKTVDHDTILDSVDELFSKRVGAVLLPQAYTDILKELDGYETFNEDTRILYDFAVERSEEDAAVTPVPEETDDPNATPQPTVNFKYTNLEPVGDVSNDPFVVYLSGSDTRSRMLATSNSDVNILVVVNPKTKQVLLLNTPRDYYVPNPAGNGALDKLTHCGCYGIGCSVKALSNLYDTPVNYYGQINFTGFETLVDAIGGIHVYSGYSFTTYNGYHIQGGYNDLNGEAALGFVRERHAFASGDRQRGNNQMKAITAIIRKLSSGRNMLLHYDSILSSLQGMFVTNLSGDEIATLVRMQLNDNAEWNVKSFAVTGGDGSEITYSIPRLRVYVMYQNPQLVSRAANLVDRVIAGETITDADVS